MSTVRLGVLGGSFDPVHNGHMAIAALAREYLDLSQVIFIPARVPPHKKRTVNASAHHRLALLELALADRADIFPIDRRELERDGPSYSIDTLTALLAEHPGAQINFIVGSDNLVEIPTWHRYREILARVTLCVAHRPGYPLTPPPALASASIVGLPSPEWGISSTMIREFVSKGYSCEGLLPVSVRRSITAQGLYRTGTLG